MITTELVEVYRSICLVQSVCAIASSIVGQATSDTYTSTGEDDSLAISTSGWTVGW